MTAAHTLTSIVTLTSMRKCRPARCITDSNKETQEVSPDERMKIRVPEIVKIMSLGKNGIGIKVCIYLLFVYSTENLKK
ncbi:hypothetical protein T552_01615 [Pneumocystis carinii B80]|uniref:Uncharacterized protein n=1 Tax=Pneumocystis carinii (strain B80) TaxID=1408658 RepID=A0A0W4ZKT7_PNEC8|nr:hypothetical protein T552_01615 [Pneumocystis carinii B80]KTW28984.1 hypothetical protein T552_01615 [Pneumocystis carinii B80]